MNDRAAKWLSDRVVPAPPIANVESWHGPGQPDQIDLTEPAIPFDEAEIRCGNYKRWSEKFPETVPHRLVEKLGKILLSIYPSAKILFRLGRHPVWPAGGSLDYVIPEHKLGFIYLHSGTSDTRKGEAEKWCCEHNCKLVEIEDPKSVSEDHVRSLIRRITGEAVESQHTIGQTGCGLSLGFRPLAAWVRMVYERWVTDKSKRTGREEDEQTDTERRRVC